MKRIICVLLMMLMVAPAYGINDWIRGDGTAAVLGTDNASDLDYNIENYLTDPLDKLLAKHVYGCTLTRTSTSVVTVGIGSVTCANAAGTIKRMRQNTATTTVDMAVAGVGGIDSGSAEKASQWYDVYAVADANATTYTAICAEQGAALSDVTYYKYIGSFYNDAAQNISDFYYAGKGSDVVFMFGVPVSLTTTLSAGAWVALTCRMPSSSTYGIFWLKADHAVAGNLAQTSIRPTGSTWTTGSTASVSLIVASGVPRQVTGQVECMTDTSQSIDYYNPAGMNSMEIMQAGFHINR